MTVLTRRYPASRYESRALLDLLDDAERERLTRPSWSAFRRLADLWGLTEDDARALLGGVPASTWYARKRADGPPAAFDVDRLTRLSYLVGIFKALRLLYDTDLADRWVRLPNTNPLFAGTTPLEHMRTGGIPAMDDVRRLLDARRAG